MVKSLLSSVNPVAVWSAGTAGSGGVLGSTVGGTESEGTGVAEVAGGVFPLSIMGFTMETTMHTAATMRASERIVVKIFMGEGPLE